MTSTHKITIIGGTGYVGLTTGACFARENHQVVCLDINKEKVDNLNNGIIPIYEEGVDLLVNESLKRKSLIFTTDYKFAVESSDILFLCLPTPTVDGKADLTFVFQSLPLIAKFMSSPKIIVGKSTVPPGTGVLIKEALSSHLAKLNKDVSFTYVSNPEFLRQGTAVHDFIHPDRIVIGVEDEPTKKVFESLYNTFTIRGTSIHFMNVMEAEIVKYASNSFLATKISFVNELANLCDKLGIDVYKVLEAWSDDKRIGKHNRHPGPGFGGSCFPKDTQALASFARNIGVPQTVVEATISSNDLQKFVLPKKVESYFKDKGIPLAGLTVGLLGLSFKPETDDMRDSSSIETISHLQSLGVNIKAYDPAASTNAKRIFGDSITVCISLKEAVSNVDAVIILTDWHEFKQTEPVELVKSCRHKVIFDARNLYIRNPVQAEQILSQGITYIGIGTRLNR